MDTLHWTTEFLLRKGLDPQLVQWIALIVDLLILLLISLLADFFARRIILSVIHGAVKRTKATWDDYFYDQKVFRNIAHLVPAGIVYESLPIV
ncbi:MAG: mechanosensitive ion channel family protein, partial [Schleiferiaceae bacterium]|nr:mechanosensitive ion channel family protein [Schleiferiaceae bacterium]